MTNPVSNNVYAQSTGSTSTSVFIAYITDRNPTSNDVQFPVQKRWINSSTEQEFFLLNFSSLGGVITANWISLSGSTGGSVDTLQGNSGGFISPTGGNIDVVGDATTINIVGNQGTSTLTANVILPATAHSILVGETSSIAGITPSATVGVPVISQGAASDPIFGTATVPGGGTGVTSLTAYAVITGGTNTTLPVQQVSGVGTSGQILTSNGANTLPTWQNSSAGGVVWSDESGAFAAVNGNGYFITATSTATLPIAPSQGFTIAFIVDTTDVLTIMGNTGQLIRISGGVSIAAGTAVSTARGNAVTLVYRSATTTWEAISDIGNWTLT